MMRMSSIGLLFSAPSCPCDGEKSGSGVWLEAALGFCCNDIPFLNSAPIHCIAKITTPMDTKCSSFPCLAAAQFGLRKEAIVILSAFIVTVRQKS